MSITSAHRYLVRNRAGDCCEYCRIRNDDRLVAFHVDHIIPRKHGGTDEIDNLCFACYKCNGYKGSNVAGFDPQAREAVLLYNPRSQLWEDHFELRSDAQILGKTPQAIVTVNVLRLNDESRVQHRQVLIELGVYPCGNG